MTAANDDPESSPHAFRIFPDWKDVMVYEEGESRTIRFDCGSVGQSFFVSVPDAKSWAGEMPPWAHEHRALILGRLRAAGCVLCEVGPSVHSTFSPNGEFRVEQYNEPDPPFPPRLELRVMRNGDDRPIARFPRAEIRGIVSFPSPSTVQIPFYVAGRQHQISIDVAAGTFCFHPNRLPLPLDQIPPLLATLLPAKIPPRVNPKSRLSAIGYLLFGLIAVGTGIWQALDGHSATDRVLGVLCAVFFGLCLILPISELRRSNQKTVGRAD